MRTTLLSTLVLLSSSVIADDAETTPVVTQSTCPKGVTSILDLRHRESGGVGYSLGYTTLDYFLAAQGDRWEVLFNARGHIFNDSKGAANVGLGMRLPVYDEKYLVGGNIFYDCRQSSHLFTNQVGGGFEWLGKSVDFRINGYIPVGKQRSLETKAFQGFSGSNVFVRQHFKGALPSIDGEIGTPLPKHFYFAAGSYYLFGQDKEGIKLGNAWGGRVRGEVNFGRHITLGAVLTYDKIFHTRFQGILSINIPLGKWKSTAQGERCLRQIPIMRNEIIPIETKRRSGVLTAGSGNDPLRFLFVNNAALLPGNGSIERPFSSLKEAEANAHPGDVIYVFPGDGTPNGMNEGIVLHDNQILAGAGNPLNVNGVEIPAQTPGATPVITNIHPDEPVVTNPGDSNLEGFVILSPWDYFFGNWGYDPTENHNLPHGNDPDLDDWEIIPSESDHDGEWEVVDGPRDPVIPAPSGGRGLNIIWDYLGGGTRQ